MPQDALPTQAIAWVGAADCLTLSPVLIDFKHLLLATEGAALSELSLSTGGGAEDGAAGTAENYGLGVREDGSDVEATGALDVHEVRVRGLHQTLELVGLGGLLSRRVKEVDSERRLDCGMVMKC